MTKGNQGFQCVRFGDFEWVNQIKKEKKYLIKTQDGHYTCLKTEI